MKNVIGLGVLALLASGCSSKAVVSDPGPDLVYPARSSPRGFFSTCRRSITGATCATIGRGPPLAGERQAFGRRQSTGPVDEFQSVEAPKVVHVRGDEGKSLAVQARMGESFSLS